MLIPGFSLLSWKAHHARTIVAGAFSYMAILVLVSFPIAIPLTDYKAAISPIAAICTLPGLIVFSQSYQNSFDSIISNTDIRMIVGFLTIIGLHLALILITGHVVRDIDTTQQARNFLIISLSVFLLPNRLRGYLAAGIVQFALLGWILGSREPVPTWSVFFLPNESTIGWQVLTLVGVFCVMKLCMQVCRFLAND